MTQDLIRYDLLVQDALKGVVRKVLGDAAREGLPGEHHFYVSFRTDFPGVRLSTRMREKYPQDMTIVLQHQFWDLSVTEHTLEVGLSFSGVPERLLIPFDALTGFFDPSVQFGLKFELQEPPALSGADAKSEKPGGDVATLRPAPDSPRTLRGAASEPETAEPAEQAGADDAPLKSGKPSQSKKPAGKTSSKGTGKGTEKAASKSTSKSDDKSTDKNTPADEAASPEDADQNVTDKTPGAEVVSLDAFRKKN